MYNGPSGPRISLTMTVSSAYITVAAHIATTALQIILLALILILSCQHWVIATSIQPAGRLEKHRAALRRDAAPFSSDRSRRSGGIPRQTYNRDLSRRPCRPGAQTRFMMTNSQP